MDKVIKIYTDGACSGNPGRGGWGAILLFADHQKEIYDGEEYTTNNKMELMAVIKSLEIIKGTYEIIIYTDSVYVKKGITEWIFNWKKNNWKTAKKQPVKNQELWQRLDEEVKKHQSIQWVWVKGHSGDYYNERADELARRSL